MIVTKEEYNKARDYFIDRYNNGYLPNELMFVLDNITRINTFEMSIREIESTIRNIRILQRYQMKHIIEAYRKELRNEGK